MPPRRSVHGAPVWAAARYQAPLDRVIQRFKYESHPDLARPLAELLLPVVGELRGTLLVPVPLHPKRLSERGYNQSALIANELARLTGARVAALALRRIRDTPRQALLARAERSANVTEAFFARAPGTLRDRRVVLVDDVVTSGATAEACLRALEAAGARILAVAAPACAGSSSGQAS